MAVSWSEFAKQIKSKYPEYAAKDDKALVRAMLAKYPDYAARIDTSGMSEQRPGIKITNKGALDLARDAFADARGIPGVIAGATVGAIKSFTGPQGQIGSGNMKASVRESMERAWRGQGIEGMLSDPLNVVPVGKIAKAVTSKLPAKAAEFFARNPKTAAAVAGGVTGAGMGAASATFDPQMQGTPLLDAMKYGAGIGALSGWGGQYLMNDAKAMFPGINVELDNRKVTTAAKRHVADNLDMILSEGILPSGKGGLLNQSAARRMKAGEKYSDALVALNQSHPRALIDLNKVRDDAEAILRKDYAELGAPRFELDLDNPAGYRLPTESVGLLDERVGNLRGTKLARLESDLGMTVPEYADQLGAGTAANPRMGGFLLSSVRGTPLPTFGTNPSFVESSLGRIVSQPGNSLTPNLLRRGLAQDEATRLATGRALNEEASRYLTPTEFSADRRRLVDPKTWQNPQTGTPSEMAQDVGLALHQAGVGQLKAYPEYASVLGGADKAFKLEKDLQSLIRSPGPMGLSHRVNLPLWNGAVDPWLMQSAKYKVGSALQSLGLANPAIQLTNTLIDRTFPETK